MADPVELQEAATALAGAKGGALVLGITALLGGLVKLFGSKPERDASTAAAAKEWRSLVEDARGLVTEARSQLARCEEEHAARDARMDELQLEHQKCTAKTDELETRLQERDEEIDWMRKAITGITGTEPPERTKTPSTGMPSLVQLHEAIEKDRTLTPPTNPQRRTP